MKEASIILACTAALLFVMGAGCAGPVRGPRQIATSSGHLIFNPEWNSYAQSPIGRRDWPATVAYERTGERVEYTVTVIDRQGLNGAHSDFVSRRFGSVRSGRLTR